MLRTLVGNPAIHHQLQKPLSHAYIIAGEEGSGRGVVLDILIAKALCQTKSACMHCPACEKLKHNSHPDLKYYATDKPLTVEQVRTLRKDALMRPNDGDKSVFVIFRGEELNTSGQNALLKLIEEPPKHALFLLVTNESASVLETIRSRCQTLTLRPVAISEIHHWITTRYPTYPDPTALAQFANGFLGSVVAQLEPNKNKKQVEPDQDSKAEFHQLKTGRKKLERLEKPLPEEDHTLLACASALAKAIIQQDELRLLEESISLEKRDKHQLLPILQALSQQLITQLRTDKRNALYAQVKLVEEISRAVEHNNMGGESVAGWLTAAAMDTKRRK